MGVDIYYTMLFADQGMGNLVSICETGTTVIDYAALIDFGTARKDETAATVDFMIEYIKVLRKKARRKYDFDFVAMSHQDEDHWTLFDQLLKKMDTLKMKPLRINLFVFGGLWADYKEDARKIAHTLSKLSNECKEMATQPSSIYAATGALKPLSVGAAADGTKYFFVPIVSNATTRCKSAKDDIKLNTTSLFVGLIVESPAGAQYCPLLLPGDTTTDTLRYYLTLTSKRTAIEKPKVLSLPHHGSSRTMADSYTSKKPIYSVAEEFVDDVKPVTLAASAGFTKHRHPQDSIIQIFAKHVNGEKTGSQHDYVSYFASKDAFEATKTPKGIFTTYTTVAPKPAAASAWNVLGTPNRIMFKITETGVNVFTLQPNSVPQPGALKPSA